MSDAAVLKDDRLRLAGLDLPARTNSTLWEAVKLLLHDDLVRAAEALGLPTHGLVDTQILRFAVGGELQLQRYSARSEKVPPNVAANHEARRAAYDELVRKLKEGKVDMAKEKKAKKVKASPRGHLYQVSAREPKELKGQAQLVYDAVKKAGPAQPAVIAVGLTKEKLKTKQDPLRVVAYYLMQFKKSGFVKTSDAPAAA